MHRSREGNARLALALLLAGLVLLVAPASAGSGAVAVLVADGKGHGHGVGMAQDGAYWMARDGASLGEILGQFYPGTQAGTADGNVRVIVLTTDGGGAVVAFPTGGELRSPRSGPQHPGFPVKVPVGGAVSVRVAGGRYHVEGTGMGGQASAPRQLPPIDPTTSTTTPPAPGPTAPPSSTTTTTSPPTPPPAAAAAPSSPEPLWAVPADFGTIAVPARGARYRGVTEVTAGGPDGPLRLVNELHVEDYLRGMGEVRDPSWPQPALQAQAVAARTYALRAMAVSGELCDTQRCQVYLGQQAEYGAMDEAVRATRGMVLVYGSGLASAVYSASGGGMSATPEEGFGTPGQGYPYLRAAPYPTPDPRPWHTEIALTDIADRMGYPGTITEVQVLGTGPSGRPLGIRLTGDAGAQDVPGPTFARALGLRSTLYEFHLEERATAPPPPPPPAGGDAAIQLPPEQAEAETTEALDGRRRGQRGPQGRPQGGLAGVSARRQDPSSAGHGLLAPLLTTAIAAAGVYGAGALRAGPRRGRPS